MRLLVQPDNGITPILTAIKKAKTHVEVVIFRADLNELQKALETAVTRGVAVHALIAHTNRGGEKRLRKLEQALLEEGVTVSRTGDDLVRYHGKMLLIDRRVLYALGFNYTHLDVFKSRSFGIVTGRKRFVTEALKVFEADTTRQTYEPGFRDLVISPENSREVLASFLKGARKQLLIYDPKVSDGPLSRVLIDRAKSGVEIRVIGRFTRPHPGILVDKLPKLRLHVRAILRDGKHLFVGSQSLRQLELDRRREIGLIVRDPSAIREFRTIFESDWKTTDKGSKQAEEAREAEKGTDKPAGKEAEKDEADREPALASK